MSEVRDIDDVRPVRAWVFDHPDMTEPLVLEGRFSERVMFMMGVIHLERLFPRLDWFVEREEGRLTMTEATTTRDDAA